jgi:hypothetical protein
LSLHTRVGHRPGSDLFAGEITLRVGGERIAVDGESTEPRRPAADIPILAAGTPTGQVPLAFSQATEQRVRVVLPDRTERPVTDVPVAVALPELCEVDVALVVDVGDAFAGGVAPVPSQVLVDPLGGDVAQVPACVLDEIRRIGVVPDEERLDLRTPLVVL